MNRLIVKTGDLVTALRLASAATELQQQGINADDLFIRNGKAFIVAESNPDLSLAERYKQLTDVRTLLNETDICARDLAGKEFTLEDGVGHARSFVIQGVWQSPIDPPDHEPFSIALPPTLQPAPEPENPVPGPEDLIPGSEDLIPESEDPSPAS